MSVLNIRLIIELPESSIENYCKATGTLLYGFVNSKVWLGYYNGKLAWGAYGDEYAKGVH